MRSTTLRSRNPAHFAWVDGAPSAVERSGTQRAAAERPQAVADPIAAALEAAPALRRSGADPKALRRALRRIEELLDE